MDKTNLLDTLKADIEHFESEIKILNERLVSLNQHLGAIKKTYTLLVEEEKIMAREITKNSRKIIQLKNGMVNSPYEEYIKLEDFEIPQTAIIDFKGIDQLRWYEKESKFIGDLSKPGEFFGEISFWNTKEDQKNGIPKATREVHILINADPRSLWKNIDPPKDGLFYKKNTDFSLKKLSNRTLMGVSIRGKSHAQKGTFRDDHFQSQSWDNGWVLQVVSDGAGSAEFSREGSKIACQSVLSSVSNYEKSGTINEIEKLIVSLNSHTEHAEASSIDLSKRSSFDEKELDMDEQNEKYSRQKLSNLLHEVTVKSAHFAYTEIEKFAHENSLKTKQFSSTLLFALSKEFEFGTVVVSFSIGDGAIGVTTSDEGRLMMKPDAGEYSGQTRFVTMKEIYGSEDIYKRTNYHLFKEKVEAIILMSDGVSDPKFGTDKNLEASEMWLKFWSELQPILNKGEVCEKDMMEWIDFHEKGEYDDRTLTVLY